MRKLYLIAGTILFLIVLAAAIFAFRDILFPIFASRPSVESKPEDIQTMAEPSPSPEAPKFPTAESRPCLIVVDVLKAKDGSEIKMGVGEIARVSSVTVADDGTRNYQLENGSLIPASACLLFDDPELFQTFVTSTTETNTLLRNSTEAQSEEERKKVEQILSPEFAKKVLMNANAHSPTWAASVLLNSSPQALDEVFALASAASPHLSETSLILALSDQNPRAFENKYRPLPPLAKVDVIGAFCEQIPSHQAIFESIMVDALNPETPDNVFNTLKTCLSNSGIFLTAQSAEVMAAFLKSNLPGRSADEARKQEALEILTMGSKEALEP